MLPCNDIRSSLLEYYGHEVRLWWYIYHLVKRQSYNAYNGFLPWMTTSNHLWNHFCESNMFQLLCFSNIPLLGLIFGKTQVIKMMKWNFKSNILPSAYFSVKPAVFFSLCICTITIFATFDSWYIVGIIIFIVQVIVNLVSS